MENKKLRSGGWQCNVEYFDDYVIKTLKTEDEMREKISKFLRHGDRLDELDDKFKKVLMMWNDSKKLIVDKKLPKEMIANAEFIEEDKIRQTRVKMLEYIFEELSEENKIDELKLLINKFLDFVIELWKYGLVESTSKMVTEFGLMGNKIVLVDFGELSDKKSTAEKQIKEMKWKKPLERDFGENVVNLFVELAKEKLTQEVLDKNWNVYGE